MRVIVREPASFSPGDRVEIPPIVMLPSGAGLVSIEPSSVILSLREEEGGAVWAPAESIFSMPSSSFGMGLPNQRVTGDFSLNDIPLPADVLQPGDLKAPTMMSGEQPRGEKASDAEQKPAAESAASAPAAQNRNGAAPEQAQKETKSADQEHK